jgi:Glycosyl transferases group 1
MYVPRNLPLSRPHVAVWVGERGRRYDFAVTRPGTAWPDQSAVFVLVRQQGDTMTPLFVGQTNNLHACFGLTEGRCPDLWRRALAHGMTHVHVRFEPSSESVRQAEVRDLVPALAPLLNEAAGREADRVAVSSSMVAAASWSVSAAALESVSEATASQAVASDAAHGMDSRRDDVQLPIDGSGDGARFERRLALSRFLRADPARDTDPELDADAAPQATDVQDVGETSPPARVAIADAAASAPIQSLQCASEVVERHRSTAESKECLSNPRALTSPRRSTLISRILGAISGIPLLQLRWAPRRKVAPRTMADLRASSATADHCPAPIEASQRRSTDVKDLSVGQDPLPMPGDTLAAGGWRGQIRGEPGESRESSAAVGDTPATEHAGIDDSSNRPATRMAPAPEVRPSISVVARAPNARTETPVVRVPPANPDESDQARAKRDLDLDAGVPVVLFAGDLSCAAGADILMDALITVCGDDRAVHFIFAGAGVLRSQLEDRARHANLDRRCRFLGHVPGRRFRRVLLACDFVVIPARVPQDGDLAALALAKGKPVLSTHQAGIALIKHGENGLVAYDNPGSLVWGLRELLGPTGGKLKARSAEAA